MVWYGMVAWYRIIWYGMVCHGSGGVGWGVVGWSVRREDVWVRIPASRPRSVEELIDPRDSFHEHGALLPQAY